MKIENLSLSFKNKTLLKELDIGIVPAEILCVIGANGSGKSTLIKTILGLNPHYTGKISYREFDWLKQDSAFKAKYCSVVFSQTHIYGHLSVLDFLSLGNDYKEDFLIERIESTNLGLNIYQDFNLLSDGEKQKLSLQRAILQNPEILILDEPTSHLDPFHTLSFLDTIVKENSENKRAIIWSTHQWRFALKYAHKLLIFLNDAKWWHGTPQECIDQKIINQLALDKGVQIDQINDFI